MPDKDLTPEEIERNRNALRHLRAWLDFRGVSQRRLAELMEVSDPTVSKWKQGKIPMSLAQFTFVAELLGAKPEELLFAPSDRSKAGRYQKIAAGIQDLDDAGLEALATIIDSMGKK